MLVLHPSSRCDVCLSEYSWEIPGLRPHAISCGHIFCMNCLIANRPPLCPLCRKEYQPNKMKKLHVDRPEELDDHRELDLLQRLAISWEVPEDQLVEITSEVDSWLRERSEDSCIALRKARAALDSHRHLKELECSFNETIRRLKEETEEQVRSLQSDTNRAVVAYEASSAVIDKLTKEINALKMQNQALQSNTQRYTHLHNPLPRPPEPIPTDKVPSLEQAVSQSGTVRFAPLPVSPRSTAGTPYPFEIERRSHRKSKTKSEDHGYHDDPSRYATTATPPAEPSHHSRRRVTSPLSHHSYDPYSSPKQTTRASGVQVHFENTAQPLDAFSLTHAYLREYSSGFINGQEAALGKTMTEFPPGSQIPWAGNGQPTSSRHRMRPTTAVEPQSQDYRMADSSNAYTAPSYSAPITHERSSRPAHRRQATATSIISTSTSSVPDERPFSSSRSRSRPSDVSSSAASPQYSNPLLASVLSDPQSPRRQSIAPVSPQPRHAVTPTILNSPPSAQLPQPAFSRNSSITPNSHSPAAPPTATNPRNSPSSSSHLTLQSSDTWGTATPSHLASGSLIDGLRAFRLGAEPVMVGGQPSVSFHELGSDRESVRTREMSIFSDVSSEPGNATSNVPPSPVRTIHSMVGVLPADGDASSFYRLGRDERERAPSYRSPTSLDTYPHSRNDRDSSISAHAGHRNLQYGTSSGVASRHRNEEDRSTQHLAPSTYNQWDGNHQQETSYRSSSSSSVHQRGHEDWTSTSRDGYHQQTRSYTSLSSRAYGADERHQRQRQSDDNASAVSSVTSSSNYSSRRPPPPHSRPSHLSLPADSPFPVSVEYSQESYLRAPSRDTDGSGSGSNSSTVRGVPTGFGNALGLQLSTSDLDDDSTLISAPTPVASVSSGTFLRSWSREHYES